MRDAPTGFVFAIRLPARHRADRPRRASLAGCLRGLELDHQLSWYAAPFLDLVTFAPGPLAYRGEAGGVTAGPGRGARPGGHGRHPVQEARESLGGVLIPRRVSAGTRENRARQQLGGHGGHRTEELRKLGKDVTWTTRLRKDSALHGLRRPRVPGKKGRVPPERRPAAVAGGNRCRRHVRAGHGHPLGQDGTCNPRDRC